jgi:hypothetical protein
VLIEADPGEIPAGLSSGVNIIHKNTKLILGRSQQDYILITNQDKPTKLTYLMYYLISRLVVI